MPFPSHLTIADPSAPFSRAALFNAVTNYSKFYAKSQPLNRAPLSSVNPRPQLAPRVLCGRGIGLGWLLGGWSGFPSGGYFFEPNEFHIIFQMPALTFKSASLKLLYYFRQCQQIVSKL
jgi:hypothetical protein